ncbi:MAG: aldo/keto reductase [Bacteroidetes bacterium]|nr:MAG: aldo/keto reductase [Bacteroidota bacterium]
MRYTPLTSSTPPVSALGLGTWQLGIDSGWKGLSEAEALALVQHALDAGVNFFDTAPNYGLGSSESRLGQALRGRDRGQVVINTKFGHGADGRTDYRAEAIRPALEGSLRRLQTDYVDSLILHNPPAEYLDGQKSAHFDILAQLKAEGKIRAYGASVDTYAEMKVLMDHTGSEVIETFFNILHQDTARAFAQAQAQGVGLIVKIPLDSGWLSGKYDAHSRFTGIRARWSEADIQIRAGLVDRLRQILDDTWPISQAALAFCLAYEAVATVIPGNTHLSQLQHNLKSIERPLPAALRRRLEQFYQEEVRPLALPW